MNAVKINIFCMSDHKCGKNSILNDFYSYVFNRTNGLRSNDCSKHVCLILWLSPYSERTILEFTVIAS